MTDQQHTPSIDDPRAAYEQGRAAFGTALVAAAAAREGAAPRRARRRRRGLAVAGGLALAGGIAVLAVGIPSPGGLGRGGDEQPGGGSVIGASPALAAVTAMRDSLRDGVLVRDAILDRVGDPAFHSRQQDWTDLATRDQRMRISESRSDQEFWNPSEHERWTLESPRIRAADGRRRVVTRTLDAGSSNASATESPVEEIERLLAQARRGELTIRRLRNGERVIEQRERCYGNPSASGGTCPDPTKPNRWPEGAPRGLTPVLMYQRWWITDDASPRMVRADNGTLAPDGTARRVVFTIRFREWRVLPRNEQTLALVNVPRFDLARFLVIDGSGNALPDAVKRGDVICTARLSGLCGRWNPETGRWGPDE